MLWGLFESRVGPVALAGERILQVVEKPPCFPLPLAPNGIAGVFLFRGDWATVLQDDAWGAGGSRVEKHGAYIVLCATDSGPIGLPVTAIRKVADLPVQVLPEKGHDPCPRGCVGSFVTDGKDYFVIEIERLLADLESSTSA